jgi:sulfide:quinone oxidoreductase
VIADGDGTLFRAFTNGWVPWSVLVGPDGKVVFSENEFDESGFSNAIQQMYERPTVAKATARRSVGSARCTVVLGGGTGGLVAARELRHRLPADHRVVLVDRAAEHVYQPSLLWQMVGERRPSQFTRPLDRLQRKGIEFRNTEAETLDLDNRVVVTASGDLDYDSLVVSLGAQLAPETVSGFDKMAHNLYTPEGCARIHAALEDLTAGVVGILISAMPYKCPAAPYEAAFLAESFIRKKGIRRNVEIHLFTPEHTPMPVAPPALGESIADMLAARGIHYHPLFTFEELRPDTREVVASDGRAHLVDLLIAVPPHHAPEVVRSSPLLGVSGFVHVDPRTLQTGYDTCADRDVATVKLPNGVRPAGVFAHAEAKMAQRIADDVTADVDAPIAPRLMPPEVGDGGTDSPAATYARRSRPRCGDRRPLHWGGGSEWWLHR